MTLAEIAVLADEPGQVQIRRGQFHAQFLLRLAAGAGVGRLTGIGVQLPAAWAPKAEIRLLRTLQQQHLIPLIKAIEQRGDFIRKL